LRASEQIADLALEYYSNPELLVSAKPQLPRLAALSFAIAEVERRRTKHATWRSRSNGASSCHAYGGTKTRGARVFEG
jgi:hypothetical protein